MYNFQYWKWQVPNATLFNTLVIKLILDYFYGLKIILIFLSQAHWVS